MHYMLFNIYIYIPTIIIIPNTINTDANIIIEIDELFSIGYPNTIVSYGFVIYSGIY